MAQSRFTWLSPRVHLIARPKSFWLETVDLLGNPISTIDREQPFFLQAFVLDLRTTGNQGVVVGFTDVTYELDLASVTGPIDHGPDYTVAQSGNSAPGALDEVGGVFNQLIAPGPIERLLFRVPFQTNSLTGTIHFIADPADVSPTHDTLLFPIGVVSTDQIEYGTASLTIVPEPSTLAMSVIAGLVFVACGAQFGRSQAHSRRGGFNTETAHPARRLIAPPKS